MHIDRTSELYAASVITSLLASDKVRLDYLNLLARSVTDAHRAKPSSWGITLFPEGVRMNVGMIEVCVLFQDQIRLVLDKEKVPDELWNIDGVEEYWYTLSPEDSLFISVDVSIGCAFPASQLSKVLSLATDPHISLIKRAARTRRNPKTKVGHSPGILTYLQSELKCTLPSPVYNSR
jgi:hypothetical protein